MHTMSIIEVGMVQKNTSVSVVMIAGSQSVCFNSVYLLIHTRPIWILICFILFYINDVGLCALLRSFEYAWWLFLLFFFSRPSFVIPFHDNYLTAFNHFNTTANTSHSHVDRQVHDQYCRYKKLCIYTGKTTHAKLNQQKLRTQLTTWWLITKFIISFCVNGKCFSIIISNGIAFNRQANIKEKERKTTKFPAKSFLCFFWAFPHKWSPFDSNDWQIRKYV